MADKVYVVTLKNRDDLDKFYSDMTSDGFKIKWKRPISRSTHYYMSDLQAQNLRGDSRVLACERLPEDLGATPVPYGIVNNEPYPHNGDFAKSGNNSGYKDWGKLHVAGTDVQRRKQSWGSGVVNDNIEVFNGGKNVDVVICDDPVSFDCEEWKALSDNRDRYVQYDWYGQLNQYVSSIDDDGMTVPSGAYSNYFDNASNSTYHGTHVCGTVAGKFYGWAPEANIYSMQVLGNAASLGTPITPLLAFDYLRAFHKYKPVNSKTGVRNPTVTNHSWGYSSDLRSAFESGFTINDYDSVVFRGVTYSASNPNPSGWTLSGIEKDFGLNNQKRQFNYHYTGVNADVEDAIEDGVIVIGAAGNNNFYGCVPESSHESYVDWNNRVFIVNSGTYYYNRGSSPNNAKDVICVGAQDVNKDFRRATFSNFGPRIDVWAPGVHTLSAFNYYGYGDTKYGGSNYYYALGGTSMASPQVCGVAACLATGKERFTNSDVKAYLQQNGKIGDMTFNTSGGAFDDLTCQGANGAPFTYYDSPNLELRVDNPRPSTGYLAGWYRDNLKGKRLVDDLHVLQHAQLFPRQNVYHRRIQDEVESHSFNVIASSGQYVFNGTDRSTTHVDAFNASLVIKKGDTLTININASSHPFWINTVNSTGNTNGVSGVTGNGTQNGSIIWGTTNVTPGTYYYNCEYHSSMNGTITVYGNNPNETYEITVTNSGSGAYTLSGTDRNGTVSGNNQTVTIRKGDLLKFIVNASGHPFWINTVNSTGNTNGVSGVTGNGTQNGSIIWGTTNVTPGTYYYNCEYHSSMNGTIVVNA